MTLEITNTIKEKGNSCLKEAKYEEAILHYSHAIKLDPNNHLLFSNRSLAFLKIQQYFLALEDARETIKLKPDWAKGYFRKAEVEYETFNFNDALLSYKIALEIQPNDLSLEIAFQKAKIAIEKEKANDEQIPWMGAAIGIFIGALVVVADHVFTLNPLLNNPVLMCLLTMGVSALGYVIAIATRYYIKHQRTALLFPPVNLFSEGEEIEAEQSQHKGLKTRYSKSR